MSFTLRLALIGAVMTGFLVLMLGQNLVHRAHGTEILVPVEGYDPRDILLGHYANIRTPLHRLNSQDLSASDDLRQGDRVYVRLETGDDGLSRAVGLSADRPAEGVFIQGRIYSAYPAQGDWIEEPDPETGIPQRRLGPSPGLNYTIRYNIERYYASQDRALALQDRLREFNEDGEIGVSLILALGRDGTPLIKGFVVDGDRRVDAVW
ncbi:GDYXXLXY domain-containing protein [Maricaulis parjimensis]|uniref:GDYXXLXY domain-containing protein n=1 Tax=Maricaulis parjimensis TaxID=144023 RepID=UPI00193A8197|nr:GDYXXLXY domain-containing protein [Maricaulis parjimensis]